MEVYELGRRRLEGPNVSNVFVYRPDELERWLRVADGLECAIKSLSRTSCTLRDTL